MESNMPGQSEKSGKFAGKTVIVTGAAQGIGAAIATCFAREGAAVMLGDIDSRFGKRRRDRIRSEGGRADFIRVDMGKPSDVRRLIRETVRTFGRIDALVNNAGVGSGTRFLSRPIGEWNRVVAVNLTGTYLAAQTAAPHLAKVKGAIVNIASTRALMSEADTEPYTATKGGIVALTHALAVTLSGKVRVNAVLPGWIDTGAWHYDGLKWDLTKKDHEQHPAGRVGKPEDIAHAVLFLCSSEAGFITGQKLVVDGGMTVKMIYAE
jgi:NAD(P)-dependent dehydrogenase (short-subunit alcohol dehydrogenase family)